VFGDDIVAYLPAHIRQFSDQLKQFPEFFEKWVYAVQLPLEFYQGDVIASLPSIMINGEGTVDRAELPAMIISCTCDVQAGQEDAALIAPVHDLEDYRKNSELAGRDLENHLRALMDNKISSLIFLPAGHGLQSSFVDLGKISTISLEYLHSKEGLVRWVSLSQCGHYFFLVKLAYHFTRPEGTDAARVG
jgi:hypothetical protein